MRLGKQDKRVIRAFTERRALEGHKLRTDGRRLDGLWMGGTDIAHWEADGKIHFVETGSRSGQTVQKAIRREAPRNDLAPGWTRGDRGNPAASTTTRVRRKSIVNPWGDVR